MSFCAALAEEIVLARPEERLGQFRADLLGTFLSFDSRYAFGDVKLLLGGTQAFRAHTPKFPLRRYMLTGQMHDNSLDCVSHGIGNIPVVAKWRGI